jgi:hypothetical protein
MATGSFACASKTTEKGLMRSFWRAMGVGGHFGLAGMRERAKLAGGKLTVRTKLDCGTEIKLTIPASLAYAKSTPTEGADAQQKLRSDYCTRVLLIAGKHAGTSDRFLPLSPYQALREAQWLVIEL